LWLDYLFIKDNCLFYQQFWPVISDVMCKKQLTFGSLFTGIGGLDFGLENAGIKCVWQVEIDEFCQKVLKNHWPDVQKYKDIKTIKELPYVDIICGVTPCQPVSVTGLRKGQKDEND